MNKLFFVLLLSLASISEARLAGNWTGWGTWKFKGEGDGANCNPMQMQWSESKNAIAIERGIFDCGIVVMHLDKTPWTLKDGLLFDEEQKEVGSYDGTNFEVFMPSPNEKTTIHIKVKRTANHYDYSEIWFNQYEKVYVIEGRLFTSGE
ncbi:MAG: hypothetical protein ABL930_06860 [Pseudobdellovibrio sp.]